ncbi:MAG: hypothetical protein ABIR68_18775 [Ilumatobacteraceae bacterium]
MSDGAVSPIDLDEFEAVLVACGVRPAFDRAADRPFVPVRRLVRAFADLIGSDDEMIAASYAFQSVVGRLAAPTLTGAIVLGCAPTFVSADVRWGVGMYGPTFGAGAPRVVPTSPDDGLDLLLGIVAELAAAMRTEVRIARRLLMGNAAAALLATLRRIGSRRGVDGAACVALATRTIDALGDPPVAALVELDGWTTFQRRTCCLLRFAGARGVCDECSFLDGPTFRDTQRAVWRGLATSG